MKRYQVQLLATAVAASLSTSVWSQDLLFPEGEGYFSWDNLKAFEELNLKGKTVTMAGPFLAPEDTKIRNVLAYFEKATGVEVQYSGSDGFEQQIVIDTQAGSPPNIAAFPQPGLAADLASKNLLVPLGDKYSDYVKENYAAGNSWVDLGTYKNKEGKEEFYGIFYKTDIKSLVWYSPDNFEDAGYETPNSMEELLALTEQMAKDGNTPWCIGLGSGGATGWPATDWVEDILLRTQKPEVYDGWVNNSIKFSDPRIIDAIEKFGTFALNDKYVAGGSASVGTTDFRDSPKGLFTVPAKCFMHHQASFIPAFFPKGTVVGEDADFFYFPSYESKDLGNPVLGAGVAYAVTKDSAATRAVMDYLLTPLANELWMAQGGFLSAHKGVNVATYENDAQRKQGEILLNATTFRFDGSDLMPGAVGAGSFWTGMVDYVGGESAEKVTKSIQKSWDDIK